MFCLAQQQVAVIYDEPFYDKSFIEDHFEGGFQGYSEFFENNLKFPEQSYKNQIEGLLLFNFTIVPSKQKVEVEFLTLLDKQIESNVREVIEKSFPKWNLTGEVSYKVYQSIVFSLLPYYPQTLKGDLPELPVGLPLKFIQPFILIKSKRLPKEIDKTILEAKDATEKQQQSYLYAQEMYAKMLELKRPEYAYEFLTQLIRYNPLRTDYLLSRIKLEKELGLNRYQVYDSDLLSDFVDSDAFESQSESLSAGTLSEADLEIIEREVMVDGIKRHVDSLYVDGFRAYQRNFRHGVHTTNLKKIESVGALIYKTKVTKDGEVLVDFLTKLDDAAVESITEGIRYSMFDWKPSQEDYEFVQIVFVNKSSNYEDQLKASVETMPNFPLNLPYLPPMDIITESPSGNGSEVIRVDYPGVYQSLLEEYQSLKENGKPKDVYKVLNQIIEYNPFDLGLIMERMKLDKEVGKSEYEYFDLNWLPYLTALAGNQ